MFWDGICALLILILAFNGFKRGLTGSWVGLIAMAIATVIVQHYYIDFSAWVLSRIRTSPQTSVLIGYVIIWLVTEGVCELLLNNLIKRTSGGAPILIDQIAGLGYGLLKGSVIVVLPLMATSVPIKIPPPPPDRSGLILPFSAETETAYFLLPTYQNVALSLLGSPIAKYVISESPPSFKLDFSTEKAKKDDNDDQ